MSSNQHSGESGARAAEQTKGVFKGLNEASEDARNNVNAFADNLLGGDHSTKTTAGGTGDVHPDAKKAGDALANAVNSAGEKMHEKNR